MRLGSVVVASALLVAGSSVAESGKVNFNLDVGLGIPTTGPYGATFSQGASAMSYGLTGLAGIDYQVLRPLALELAVGGGFTVLPPLVSRANGRDYVYGVVPGFFFGAGPRLRFKDDESGYLDEKGNAAGNGWASAHFGINLFDGPQFGIDAAVGYQYSVKRPFSVGPFARAAVLFAPRANTGTTLMFVLGVSMSWELMPHDVPLVDTDDDGISDSDEANKYGTDPANKDTDGDGLDDGLEIRTATNPAKRDTDGDGLEDQVEDANQNGGVDLGETDPRQYDTDKDGVKDGGKKPLVLPTPKTAPPPPVKAAPAAPAPDADGDGVEDAKDSCPGTAAKLTVDEKGCVVLRGDFVLEGVTFASGKADVLPASAKILEQTLPIFSGDPSITVEVGGHTDSAGSPAANLALSEARAKAVVKWLVAHGVAAVRLTSKGYGASVPRAGNETADGRAANRRIEFKKTSK